MPHKNTASVAATTTEMTMIAPGLDSTLWGSGSIGNRYSKIFEGTSQAFWPSSAEIDCAGPLTGTIEPKRRWFDTSQGAATAIDKSPGGTSRSSTDKKGV